MEKIALLDTVLVKNKWFPDQECVVVSNPEMSNEVCLLALKKGKTTFSYSFDFIKIRQEEYGEKKIVKVKSKSYINFDKILLKDLKIAYKNLVTMIPLTTKGEYIDFVSFKEINKLIRG